jgi:hypothetical protein
MRVPINVATPGELQRVHIEARYAAPSGQRTALGLALTALMALCGYAFFERSRRWPLVGRVSSERP